MHNMNNVRVICALPKFSYGSKNRDFSTEYQSFYPEIKKKFKNTIYFNTIERNITLENMNKKFIDICLKFKPNYIFMSIANYEIYIETLVLVKKKIKTVLLNWCSDDSWRFYEHSRLYGKFFDYSITTDKKACLKYKQNNLGVVLANWGCPNSWITKPKKSNECKYDIAFIGSSYMGRHKIIKKINNSGYKVTCFGFGWYNKPVKSSNFSKILNNSKISLNFSKSRKGVLQTKARIFETTGSGSLCISEKSNDLKNFFNLKTEISVFNDHEDLIKKISFFLRNPKTRDRVALNGYKKCKNNYRYSMIISNIFSKIRIKKIKKNIETIKYENYYLFLFIFFLIIKIISIFFIPFMRCGLAQKIFRRISFEIEWRIRSELVYSKKGLTSRFYGNI
jgi:spore maturation protein CgeB